MNAALIRPLRGFKCPRKPFQCSHSPTSARASNKSPSCHVTASTNPLHISPSQTNSFSTSPDPVEEPRRPPSPPAPLSLRRIASPFLLLCHPDKFSHIESARKVNLDAIQTLNGFIDAVDNACRTNHQQRVELEDAYTIEFAVPSATGKKITVHGEEKDLSCTRREVTLTLGVNLLEGARHEMHVDGARIRSMLRKRAKNQISKLLHAAGLIAPREDANAEEEEEEDDAYGSRDVVLEDLGIHTTKKMTTWEQSRATFMNRIDWGERQRQYDIAMQAYRADIATLGFATERQKKVFVAELVAKIRVENADEDEVDIAHQLIALRRLSLLLLENFSSLGMEDRGKMWERLVIVLKGYPEGRQRKKRMSESGFKFAWGVDERMTVTVPDDFMDDELIEELKEHVTGFRPKDSSFHQRFQKFQAYFDKM